MKKLTNNVKLNSAEAVWKFLKKSGGLDIKNYDEEIGNQICKRLGLSIDRDISNELKSKNVSIEALLYAFFSAIHPFSEMLKDLLRLLESKNVRETNNNIKIKFNFEKSLEPLEFKLESFKAWEEEWRDIEKELCAIDINNKVLINVDESVRTLIDSINESVNSNDALYDNEKGADEIYSQEIHNWLSNYYSCQLNENTPQFPLTNDVELDRLLLNIRDVWNEVIQEIASLDMEYRDFREIKNISMMSKELQIYVPGEIDFFLGGFLENYCKLVYQMNSLEEEKKKGTIGEVTEELKSYIENIPLKKIEAIERQRKLVEFLNLPIWKKRYELYAAWVLTQINEAIGEDELQFHSINERLEFSFAGSHLATTKNYIPPIHVWSEHRSPLSNPIGKGRKKAIQPDYSLIVPPISNTLSTVLVVECKQYKKFAKKHFKDALTDYANGRENAKVVIVNYGPVNEKILEEIDENISDRTYMIGRLYPGQKESIQKFKKYVKTAINSYKLGDSPLIYKKNNSKLKELRNIKLTWSGSPMDLDVYILIKNKDGNYKICHSNKGNLMKVPWLELKEDIQSGHGPEIVNISSSIEGEYLVAVHNYSAEVPISKSNAKLDLKIAELQLTIDCPKIGFGKWWIVLKCNPLQGTYNVCNILQDATPSI
ncbi:hypothetical protein ACWKTX_19595 [Bacillus thuringiensis]